MHVFRVSYKAGRREGCASVSGQAITLAEPGKDGQGYRGDHGQENGNYYIVYWRYMGSI